MAINTDAERAILYREFCEWCYTVPHLDLDPRLHTHSGRIEDGGYISNGVTAKAFAAWQAARRALAAPLERPEPDAWAAVYFSGKRAGKIYTTCDTKEQIEAYIHQVHQSNDSITLRAEPIYMRAAPQPQADALDAERWRFVKRKLCLTGNGDGTCAMQALNLPARILGWPDVGELAIAKFLDDAIDAAIAAAKENK